MALQTLYMPQDHTGLYLAEVLCETLETRELSSENLLCLSTDSRTNIVSAAQQFKWARLSCFGHNLHNAVNSSIKDDPRVSRAAGVCGKIICTFSHGWKKRRDLAKFQLDHGLPQHSLVTDYCTRWGSKQRLISRILEQEAAILGLDRKCTHLISL